MRKKLYIYYSEDVIFDIQIRSGDLTDDEIRDSIPSDWGSGPGDVCRVLPWETLSQLLEHGISLNDLETELTDARSERSEIAKARRKLYFGLLTMGMYAGTHGEDIPINHGE